MRGGCLSSLRKEGTTVQSWNQGTYTQIALQLAPAWAYIQFLTHQTLPFHSCLPVKAYFSQAVLPQRPFSAGWERANY